MTVKPASFPDTLEPAAHEALVLAWRRARVARLTAPDSWLSLSGRSWLHEGDNFAGSAEQAEVLLPAELPARIGTFRVAQGGVSFVPEPSVEVQLHAANGERLALHEPRALVTDSAGSPDRLLIGTITLEILERGGEFAVRMRDSQSPLRLQFTGIDYFPINARLRVVAKLEPYTPPKTLRLAYESGRDEAYVCPGAAVFTLDGVEHRVEPVIDGNRERLYLLFADGTSRHETYGAGRFLYAPLPQDGRVLLDFNQAFNPPCAFTPYAVCPLTPPQNRLSVRIEAGEKTPRAHALPELR